MLYGYILFDIRIKSSHFLIDKWKVNLNNGLHLEGGWIGAVELNFFSQQGLPSLKNFQCL